MWLPAICRMHPASRLGLGIAYEPELISADAKKFAPSRMWWWWRPGFSPPTEARATTGPSRFPGDRTAPDRGRGCCQSRAPSLL